MEKRTYSLNLATYIIMETGIEPDIGLKDERQLGYFVFPENEFISKVIAEYKADKRFQDYLHTYARLREQIKAAREG